MSALTESPFRSNMKSMMDKLPPGVRAPKWYKENALDLAEDLLRQGQLVDVIASANGARTEPPVEKEKAFITATDDLRPLFYVPERCDKRYQVLTIGGPQLQLQAFQFLLKIVCNEKEPEAPDLNDMVRDVVSTNYDTIKARCESRLKEIVRPDIMENIVGALCKGRKMQHSKLNVNGIEAARGKAIYDGLIDEDLKQLHLKIKTCKEWFTQTKTLCIQLSRSGHAIDFRRVKDVR